MSKWVLMGTEAMLVWLLLTTFWQDIRSRSVEIWVLILLMAGVSALRLWSGLPYLQLGLEVSINTAIMGLQLLVITGYLSVKHHTFTQPIGQFLGLGDVVFWLIPILFFPPGSFIWFLTGSSLFALLTHGMLRLAMPHRYPSTIPLAGLQALWMSAVIVYEKIP